MKPLIAALSIVLSVAALGCAKTGSTTERAPLTQSLAAYRSASVEVEMPASMMNAEQQKNQFTSHLLGKLREKKIFTDVGMSGGDVTLRVKVTAVDNGNKGLQAMTAGGDAEIHASVDLFDAKQSKSVGAFDVTGNSTSNMSTSVGGVNTKAMGDTTDTALAAAADEIVAYLEKHR